MNMLELYEAHERLKANRYKPGPVHQGVGDASVTVPVWYLNDLRAIANFARVSYFETMNFDRSAIAESERVRQRSLNGLYEAINHANIASHCLDHAVYANDDKGVRGKHSGEVALPDTKYTELFKAIHAIRKL